MHVKLIHLNQQHLECTFCCYPALENPMFIKSTQTDSVVETNMGHSYHVMDCSATGVPGPSIQWFKDGQLLNFTSDFLGLSLSDDNTRYVQWTSPCPFGRNYFTVCMRTRPEACSTNHMLMSPCQNLFLMTQILASACKHPVLWTGLKYVLELVQSNTLMVKHQGWTNLKVKKLNSLQSV